MSFMNMEEWQRKLRAEKEASRKKKTEAAQTLQNFKSTKDETYERIKEEKVKDRQKKLESSEMLKNYRGGLKEDDLKLTALKEKERQGKKESEVYLRQYRGGVKEEDMKLAALREEERKKKQDAEQYLHKYQGIDGIEIKQRERPVRNDEHVPPPVNANKDDKDDNFSFTPGAVSAIKDKFSNPSTPIAPGAPGSMAVKKSPALGPSNYAKADNESSERSVDENRKILEAKIAEYDQSSTVSTSDSVLKTLNSTVNGVAPPATAGVFDTAGPSKVDQSTSSVGGKFGDANDRATVEEKKSELDTSQQPATQKSNISDEPVEGHPTVVRLDVLFSFGLVTSSSTPTFDNYMVAVQQVVKATLDADPGLASCVKYDPHFSPFVKDVAADGTYADRRGRSYVKRLLVVAAVPVFLSNGISIAQARDGIVGGLQGAIESGKFVAIARGKEKKKSSRS